MCWSKKQATVPDTYPLTLNALTAGCNQKTAREPVMHLSESEVLTAANELRELGLVAEVSGSRVTRFEHHGQRGLGVPSQSMALLAILMLRGPQTAAELRLHTERLHRFADVSSVETFLDELAQATPPRVVKLPRAPGTREARWAHLLCGAPTDTTTTPTHNEATPTHDLAELLARQDSLEAEVHALREAVAELTERLNSLQA